MMDANLQREALRAHARFQRGLSRLHAQFAHELSALVGHAEDRDDPPVARGALQRRILQQPRLFTERGMTAGEIARALRHDEANAHTSLNSLQRAGMLELVEGTTPRRWRFAQSQRTDRVLRLSRLVKAGEWTTYGDMAIAVYDSTAMSRAVARAAAKNPAFANPHRVLLSDGAISSGWRDADGRGPEHCRALLKGERVRFDPDGRADRRRRVYWEELRHRLDADEAAGDHPAI